MGMHTPADHAILTSQLSTTDMTAADILPSIQVELDTLLRKARNIGCIVISHTVTFFTELQAVVFTLHIVKP